MVSKSLGIMTYRNGNQKKTRDHLDDSIVKINQNTEKIHGDLKIIAVIQTPLNDHQLILA